MVKVYLFMTFILTYCIDVIRNVNLLSFACETCVIYINILIVVSQFFLLIYVQF